MVANRKVTGKAMSLPGGVMAGVGISVLITLFGCCLLAYLVCNEKVNVDQIGYGSMLILGAASCVGAWSAVAMVKSRRELVAMIFAAAYFLLLLSITALFFGGEFRGMGTTALVILAAAATTFLKNLKGNKHPYKGNNGRRIR